MVIISHNLVNTLGHTTMYTAQSPVPVVLIDSGSRWFLFRFQNEKTKMIFFFYFATFSGEGRIGMLGVPAPQPPSPSNQSALHENNRRN